jgi:hypothetical protein
MFLNLKENLREEVQTQRRCDVFRRGEKRIVLFGNSRTHQNSRFKVPLVLEKELKAQNCKTNYVVAILPPEIF